MEFRIIDLSHSAVHQTLDWTYRFQNFLNKNGHSMFQKFLKNISKGDKRIFIIDGKVCGAISRVPKKGSYLSNMSKGAVPKLTKLTKQEIKISKLIGKKLKNKIFKFLTS